MIVMVIASVEGVVDRTALEQVEGQVFGSLADIYTALGSKDVYVYTLSDFMDAMNNEEISEPNNWFGYVEVPDAK